jgi:hypothetical protein
MATIAEQNARETARSPLAGRLRGEIIALAARLRVIDAKGDEGKEITAKMTTLEDEAKQYSFSNYKH